jgi:hypothetical protein
MKNRADSDYPVSVATIHLNGKTEWELLIQRRPVSAGSEYPGAGSVPGDPS